MEHFVIPAVLVIAALALLSYIPGFLILNTVAKVLFGALCIASLIAVAVTS